MKVENPGDNGRLPKSTAFGGVNVADQQQLRDAPISLARLKEICEYLEKDLTASTPQEKQYIQLHIRQVRGLLNEVAMSEMKLQAALQLVADMKAKIDGIEKATK